MLERYFLREKVFIKISRKDIDDGGMYESEIQADTMIKINNSKYRP